MSKISFPTACFPIMNVLICGYKHWVYVRSEFYTSFIIKLALDFLYACLFRWLCESIPKRGIHSHLADSKGDRQCLYLGDIIKASFILYNLLTSGKSLTQHLPLQSQYNTHSRGFESTTGRHQWAEGSGSLYIRPRGNGAEH